MLDRKLAVVDLSKGKVSIEEPSNDLKKAFLGGRGLNSYYLYKHLRPRVNPLSPSNVLIIGTGFLTGTLAPSSSRFNASAKSPESNILGDSNCGG
ncbi:MAG: aldehyde:ferredoxin oxidoreductase, partial [Thermoplasmata archaeon]|nr:aldehyde:ferredoxin oxidoreductase [Thermoplasmata archaeon]